MELIITSNEIELNFSVVPDTMILEYHGSFVGEIFGDNIVTLNRKNIIINFQTKPPSLLMSYTGKLAITDVKTFDKQGFAIDTNRIVREDKWGIILGDYANNTNKYIDYNQSMGYNFVEKTLISYNNKNTQYYLNQKGIISPNRESMEFKKLNRIRGNYGIKQ